MIHLSDNQVELLQSYYISLMAINSQLRSANETSRISAIKDLRIIENELLSDRNYELSWDIRIFYNAVYYGNYDGAKVILYGGGKEFDLNIIKNAFDIANSRNQDDIYKLIEEFKR